MHLLVVFGCTIAERQQTVCIQIIAHSEFSYSCEFSAVIAPNCCNVVFYAPQVVTLLARMEHLRGIGIPAPIHLTMTRLMDSIMKVQACRREEIVNAINRHQSRDASQLQKEKGGSCFAGIQLYYIRELNQMKLYLC